MPPPILACSRQQRSSRNDEYFMSSDRRAVSSRVYNRKAKDFGIDQATLVSISNCTILVEIEI